MHVHGASAVVDGALREQTCVKAVSGLITTISFNCAETPDSFHAGTLIPGFVDIHSSIHMAVAVTTSRISLLKMLLLRAMPIFHMAQQLILPPL